MSDWDQLLQEGRAFQREKGIAPPAVRPPSMVPWVVLAGLLVAVSLGIELFWPLPGHQGSLPVCQPSQAASKSCQKVTTPTSSVEEAKGRE
ncbi:hypothetical protein GS501_09620 [Saccharibacter sp. 17.LH.SD]|uniref:hypothetical protein n=1 Tax=Saccharibacter sp. 17.LH.SD TaxID=2689393 RepID=UPI001370C6FC|nr:hypothetical protein [Saccharibacter sp. 17.LH.SD]MXV45288.1 hypothetical protein [Saccharibacter sp. 17.LH.SD]